MSDHFTGARCAGRRHTGPSGRWPRFLRMASVTDHAPWGLAARSGTRSDRILSLIIDEVAGFVSSGGSALCDLAIVLREANKPAVVTCEDLGINDGRNVLIVEGGSHVSQRASAHAAALPDSRDVAAGPCAEPGRQ
ncbi:PEP-utilizing enzyme [Parafrankia colletiae]|uniref:PEP-utilizing enzyme n=1 Tax=Parafrankia colletiae TaxID=573497 RepID=UPI000A05523D